MTDLTEDQKRWMGCWHIPRGNCRLSAAKTPEGEVIGVQLSVLVKPADFDRLPLDLRIMADGVYAKVMGVFDGHQD